MHIPSFLTTALLAGSFASAVLADASRFGRFGHMARQKMARGAEQNFDQEFDPEKRDTSKYKFLTAKTKPYLVDSMPNVQYDIGELYSGLVPVHKGNMNRQLFFAFAPKHTGAPVNEITIWFNGGPGCSSLLGFLQENGRFRWQPGTRRPVENPYAWNNLTNMLWIEQPVGTGYSIGKVTATSQEETAQDVVDWFLNWSELFGVKNHKIYVTGESYAGRYVPYVSAAFLNQKDKVNYDLSGAMVYDPCIGAFDYAAEEATVVPLVQKNPQLFNFNSSFMATLEKLHKSCGYASFIDKYLQYPPPGKQPPKKLDFKTIGNCDVFDLALIEVLANNPCFNPYSINQQCPLPWDVLGFPTILNYLPKNSQIYFNRDDVKKALHAPLDVQWAPCSNKPVYIGGKNGRGGPQGEGDLSLDPIQHVLPQVIEATNRVLVANGDLDMIIITDGVLLSIQNMTWNGKLGFQKKPSTPIDIHIPDLEYHQVFVDNGLGPFDLVGQGVMGIQHYERGLMWGETFQSGHEGPEFQSRVSYRHLQWLLGHVNTL